MFHLILAFMGHNNLVEAPVQAHFTPLGDPSHLLINVPFLSNGIQSHHFPSPHSFCYGIRLTSYPACLR